MIHLAGAQPMELLIVGQRSKPRRINYGGESHLDVTLDSGPPCTVEMRGEPALSGDAAGSGDAGHHQLDLRLDLFEAGLGLRRRVSAKNGAFPRAWFGSIWHLGGASRLLEADVTGADGIRSMQRLLDRVTDPVILQMPPLACAPVRITWSAGGGDNVARYGADL
jgi:hypothetical protein